MVALMACTKSKESEDQGIDLKDYEKSLDRSEELSMKEQELREKELELLQKEAELYRQNMPNSEPEKRIIPAEPHSTNSGAIPGDYPEASRALLTANELRNTPKELLEIMRNEIFARHGYIFKRSDLHNHFMKKGWYTPKHKDVSDLLTKIEKQNIELIKAFEDL
jgi:hypothetical protein